MSIIKYAQKIIDLLQSPTVAMQLPGTVQAHPAPRLRLAQQLLSACPPKFQCRRRPNPPYFAKGFQWQANLLSCMPFKTNCKAMCSRVEQIKKLCKWLQSHICFLNYDKTPIKKNSEQGRRSLLFPVVFEKNVGQKLQLNCTYFLFLCALTTCNLQGFSNDQFTIMIDPAGDAKHTGRLIGDTLERGISLQCAEQLKTTLLQKFKNVRVILTRVPGETLQPLQNASFANRLGVDLYISLYFYHEPENPAHVTLYYYLENPIADAWHKPTNLALYQVNQAHLLNLKTTQAWGKIILDVLYDKRCSKFFSPRGLFGIPFVPLVGIKAPAIALEVGLKNKQDWQHITDPLVFAIERIMQ